MPEGSRVLPGPKGRSCSTRLPSMRLKPVRIPEAQGDPSPSSQTSRTSKLLVAVLRKLACFNFQKAAALFKCSLFPPHWMHLTGTSLSQVSV